MKKYQITNQRDLRRAFWEHNPYLVRTTRRRIRGELAWPVEVRCCFVDWIDSLCRDGTISEALAQRATLEG